MADKKSKKRQPRTDILKHAGPLSKAHLLIAVAIFAVVGGYVLLRSFAATVYYVSASGSDTNACTQAAPCANFSRAYQVAQPGDTVQVAAGTYSNQVLTQRADLRNLSPGCSAGNTAQCIHFVGSGVKVNGSLEIHSSSVWIDGGTSSANPGFNVTGYIDTEADSNTIYPDHVYVNGTHSTSFGVFNANTVTFKNMDVGPATVSTGCGLLQGPGIENKIGFGGGNTVVPTNVTLDGLTIHDQNGDSGRIASDCHFGGLFLVTANGLTVKNSVFQGNVVYNVQIQNFGGAPAAANVIFDNDAFSCPVNWLYQNDSPLACDGQSSIQFDGTFPGITIKNSAFAEGGNAGWGCYVGTCDYSQDTFSGNTYAAPSVIAPPLPTPISTTTGSYNVTVSLSGNDSTCVRGDSTKPCATFQRAYQLAQGGDSIGVNGGAYPADYPGEGALKLKPDSTKSSTPVTFVCGNGQPVTFASGADQVVITAQHVAVRGSCFKFNRLWVGDPANGVGTQDVTVDSASMMMFDISGSDNVTIQNSTVGPDVACYAPGTTGTGNDGGTITSGMWCQNNTADNEAYFAVNGRSNTQYSEPKIHYGGAGGGVNPTNIKILNNNFVQMQTRDSFDLHTGCLWIGYGTTGGPLLIQGNKFSGCAVYDTHVDVPSTWNITFDSNTYGYPVVPIETGNNFNAEAPASETDIQVKCQAGQLLTNYALTKNTFAHGWDLDFGGCGGATYSGVTIAGNSGGSTQNPAQSGSTPTSAPTVSLSASPSSVAAGSSSNLTWTSTNATSCTASGAWSGSEATSGSQATASLSANSTFSLTCTGAGGSATASATVTVNAPTGDTTPPSVSITSPANGATVSFAFEVFANATDNIGVSKVDFYADGTLISTATASPYVSLHWDSTKVPNGSHSLMAVATDAAGNSSTSSIAVNVANGDTTPPSAPSGLSAAAVSSTQVNLAWTASSDNVGVAGYYIVRNGVTIAKTTGTATAYSDSSLIPSTSYSYQVMAYDAAGNTSNLSNTASVVTPAAPDTTAPSQPANLAASAVSASQVNLAWTASSDNVGVAGYSIYRNSTKIASVNTTSYGDTGLSAATSYSYYVVAFDAAGNVSPASATASATTLSPPPPAQTGSLTGTVYDATSGKPLAGVSISLSFSGASRFYTSGSNGTYSISGIPGGTYSVSYYKWKYRAQNFSLNVVNGSTTTKNVNLRHR